MVVELCSRESFDGLVGLSLLNEGFLDDRIRSRTWNCLCEIRYLYLTPNRSRTTIARTVVVDGCTTATHVEVKVSQAIVAFSHLARSTASHLGPGTRKARRKADYQGQHQSLAWPVVAGHGARSSRALLQYIDRTKSRCWCCFWSESQDSTVTGLYNT
jgi:hypothetical protein